MDEIPDQVQARLGSGQTQPEWTVMWHGYKAP